MKHKDILLVEDNRDDELLAMRALYINKIPNKVIVVRDGAEALDYLFGTGLYVDRDVRQTPALVLLDMKLPKIDGLTVLRRIRADEHLQFLPVVILTSSTEEEDLIKAYRYGCNSYVRKPVDFDAFIQATRQLGLYWLSINQSPPG